MSQEQRMIVLVQRTERMMKDYRWSMKDVANEIDKEGEYAPSTRYQYLRKWLRGESVSQDAIDLFMRELSPSKFPESRWTRYASASGEGGEEEEEEEEKRQEQQQEQEQQEQEQEAALEDIQQTQQQIKQIQQDARRLLAAGSLNVEHYEEICSLAEAQDFDGVLQRLEAAELGRLECERRQVAEGGKHLLDALGGCSQQSQQAAMFERIDDLSTGWLREDRQLFAHQKVALEWMLRQELTTTKSRCFRGGLLADEMGLGKTLSVLSTIAATKLRGDGPRGPTLIVCPKSVIPAWSTNDFKKHFSDDFMASFTIESSSRGYLDAKETETTVEQHLAEYQALFQAADLVVCGRESAMQKYFSAFSGVRWRRIVIDEVHQQFSSGKLTGKLGRRTRFGAMDELMDCVVPGGSRWVMTGTPITNKPAQLKHELTLVRAEPWCNDPRLDKDFRPGEDLQWTRQLWRDAALGRTKHEVNKDSVQRKGPLMWTEGGGKILPEVHTHALISYDVVDSDDPGYFYHDSNRVATEGLDSILEGYLRRYVWNDAGSKMYDFQDGKGRVELKTQATTTARAWEAVRAREEHQRGAVGSKRLFVPSLMREVRTKVVMMSHYTAKFKTGAESIMTKAAAMLVEHFDFVPFDGEPLTAVHPFPDGRPRFGMIKSGTTAEYRTNLEAAFTAHPDVCVVLGGTLSAGVGINLQAANVLMMLEPEWTDAAVVQAMDRINRLNSLHEDNYVFCFVSSAQGHQKEYEKMLAKRAMSAAYMANMPGRVT
jgi:hypothetical protein